MRRFNYDENEDYREDVDKFFGDQNDQFDDFPEEDGAVQQIQIKLVSRDLNYRAIRGAVRTLEKSFWWRFYSLDTRLKMIEKVYLKFRELEDKE